MPKSPVPPEIDVFLRELTPVVGWPKRGPQPEAGRLQRVTSPTPSQCFGLSRPLKPLDKGTCLSAAASDRAYYSTCSQQDVRPDQTQRAPRSAGRGKQWFALLVSECVAVAGWWKGDSRRELGEAGSTGVCCCDLLVAGGSTVAASFWLAATVTKAPKSGGAEVTQMNTPRRFHPDGGTPPTIWPR
jgi:hypothetical protein